MNQEITEKINKKRNVKSTTLNAYLLNLNKLLKLEDLTPSTENLDKLLQDSDNVMDLLEGKKASTLRNYLASIVVYLSLDQNSQKKTEVAVTKVAKTVEAQQEKEAEKKEPLSLSPDVLAQVGDWSISIQEFKKRLEAVKTMVPDFDPTDIDQKKYILSELVQQQLLVQEALSQKLDKTERQGLFDLCVTHLKLIKKLGKIIQDDIDDV